MNTSTIPDELRDRPQWIVWRFEEVDGRRTKVPYNAKNGRKASTTDPKTWASHDVVTKALWSQKWAGPGYVFSADDPYTGIDLDHAVDADGSIAPDAKRIIDELASYTELSPSGEGAHILVRAKLPDHGRKSAELGIEMYDAGRFFTVTGNHLAGTPTTIAERQDATTDLYTRTFPPKPEKPRQNTDLHLDMADTEIIELARKARNGGKFQRLMAGDMSDYPRKDGSPDHSAADQALCNQLAFWTRDAAQIDRIMRSSGLMRDKWDSRRGQSTYGTQTIQNALEYVRERYTPRDVEHELKWIFPSRKDEKPHADAELQDDIPEPTREEFARLYVRMEELETLVARLESENQRLRTALEDNAKRSSLEARVLRNRALKSERETVVALSREIQSAISTGKVAPGEPVPIYLAQIADSAGKSPQTVSANLKRLEERGQLTREVVQEIKREVDPETGEVLRKVPVTRLLVKIDKPVTDWLAAQAAYEPEPDETTWGGRRITCPKHPHAGVIITKTVECAECGDILHRELKHAASFTPSGESADDVVDVEPDSGDIPQQDQQRGLTTIGDDFDTLAPIRINPHPTHDFCSGCGTRLRTPLSQDIGWCATCRAEQGSAGYAAAGGAM